MKLHCRDKSGATVQQSTKVGHCTGCVGTTKVPKCTYEHVQAMVADWESRVKIPLLSSFLNVFGKTGPLRRSKNGEGRMNPNVPFFAAFAGYVEYFGIIWCCLSIRWKVLNFERPGRVDMGSE